MSAICHVTEHPQSDTLARVDYYDTASEPPLPLGKVRRTPAEQKAWESAEIAAGWTPQPVPLTQEQQAVETAEQNERTAMQQILATADDMINGVGTSAERQRRVEVALGRLLKRLAKNGTIP